MFVKKCRTIHLLALLTIILVVIGIAALFLETPPRVYSFSGNLIVNSTFQDGLTGWSPSQQTAGYSLDVNTSIYSGCCSAMGTETGNTSIGLFYQDVSGVTHPGGSYRISGWIKTKDLVGVALIALDYVNSDAKSFTPADGHVVEIGRVDSTTGWTFFQSSVFTLPSKPVDASALWFYFDISNGVGAGTAWFDGLTLVATVPESCLSADSSNNFQESVPLTFGVATADLWNMQNATGYAEQCYGPTTGLSSSILLNQVSLIQPFDFVVGYPEVAFGHNYMGQEFGQSDLASIKFPMQLQSLQNSGMWANVTYSISSSHPSQMDFAYDLWVKNSSQVGVPSSGDYEIMIDPVDTFLYTSVPEATMNNESIVIDGLKQSSSWSVFQLSLRRYECQADYIRAKLTSAVFERGYFAQTTGLHIIPPLLHGIQYSRKLLANGN